MSVRNSIKTISVEVSRYDEVGQILRILLNNLRQKIRIGVIYGPQDNMTPNNELKLLCKTIAAQIEIIKEKYQPFQYKDKKPYSRQQRNNIKRRKATQKNNWEI